MDFQKIIDLFLYTTPAIITGLIAYYFFKQHIKNEDNRRIYLLKKDTHANALPLRLQAYERMSLYLERIKLSKLLIRVNPLSSNSDDYASLLIDNIEQEFEHNLSQQIYVSDKCWNVIVASKNTTIQLIRKANFSEKTDTSDKLREGLLNEMMGRMSPSDTALAFIKEEVSDIW